MDVRTEILQVSLKLFNEFGSENISTNEIAKKTDSVVTITLNGQ